LCSPCFLQREETWNRVQELKDDFVQVHIVKSIFNGKEKEERVQILPIPSNFGRLQCENCDHTTFNSSVPFYKCNSFEDGYQVFCKTCIQNKRIDLPKDFVLSDCNTDNEVLFNEKKFNEPIHLMQDSLKAVSKSISEFDIDSWLSCATKEEQEKLIKLALDLTAMIKDKISKQKQNK